MPLDHPDSSRAPALAHIKIAMGYRLFSSGPSSVLVATLCIIWRKLSIVSKEALDRQLTKSAVTWLNAPIIAFAVQKVSIPSKTPT